MTAGTYDMYVEMGATFTRTITYNDSNNNPVDLTGYTARMKARKTYNSDAIIDLTTENGGIALGGAAGTITVSMSAATTEALNNGQAFEGIYDLEIVNGAVVTRLIEGDLTISREVTYG